jgi:transposase
MARSFRPASDLPRIFLYRDAVDFRKQCAGLAAIVERELRHNPFDGGLYAFTNRQRNKIKCLYWENNGFVLYYKCLAEEKFRWPRRGEEVLELTAEQMNWLLDGYDIALLKGHKKLHFESVF